MAMRDVLWGAFEKERNCPAKKADGFLAHTLVSQDPRPSFVEEAQITVRMWPVLELDCMQTSSSHN
jgi:hypothetical protein